MFSVKLSNIGTGRHKIINLPSFYAPAIRLNLGELSSKKILPDFIWTLKLFHFVRWHFYFDCSQNSARIVLRTATGPIAYNSRSLPASDWSALDNTDLWLAVNWPLWCRFLRSEAWERSRSGQSQGVSRWRIRCSLIMTPNYHYLSAA